MNVDDEWLFTRIRDSYRQAKIDRSDLLGPHDSPHVIHAIGPQHNVEVVGTFTGVAELSAVVTFAAAVVRATKMAVCAEVYVAKGPASAYQDGLAAAHAEGRGDVTEACVYVWADMDTVSVIRQPFAWDGSTPRWDPESVVTDDGAGVSSALADALAGAADSLDLPPIDHTETAARGMSLIFPNCQFTFYNGDD